MARTTKAHVEAAFRSFVARMDGRIATSYNDVGAYRLDHNGIYGGWNIEEIVTDGGGIRHPFGAMRRNNRDMYDTLHFASDALWEKAREPIHA